MAQIRGGAMKFSKAIQSSFLSLILTVVAVVAYKFCYFLVDVIWTDYLHSNPHRTQFNAAILPFVLILVGTPFFFVGMWIVFGLAQVLFAIIVVIFRDPGRRAMTLFIALPAAAALSWHCYDNFIPDRFGILAGPDWVPYEHGMTRERFRWTLGAQTLVWGFSLWRLPRS